jgi:outer membrane biosynthesis protein TonB
MSVFCPSCKKENPTRAQFCRFCGSPINPVDKGVSEKSVTEEPDKPQRNIQPEKVLSGPQRSAGTKMETKTVPPPPPVLPPPPPPPPVLPPPPPPVLPPPKRNPPLKAPQADNRTSNYEPSKNKEGSSGLLIGLVATLAIAIGIIYCLYYAGIFEGRKNPSVERKNPLVEQTSDSGTQPAQTETNRYVEQMQQDISTIRNYSELEFCSDLYKNAIDNISEYSTKKILGQNNDTNRQMQRALSEELYNAYAGTFVKQAFYFFNNSDWGMDSLQFVNDETSALAKSDFLERGSRVADNLNEIIEILQRYNEIAEFIASVREHAHSDVQYKSINTKYPVSADQSFIAKAETFESNNLGNQYLNQCRRIHDALHGIPDNLYSRRMRYLENKVSYFSNQYDAFNTYNEYNSKLGSKIDSELSAVSSSISIYGLSQPDDNWEEIKKKWDIDKSKAKNELP